MNDRLVHRGPDDQDTWVEADAGLAFGFRRLAIVDLSIEGRQPMKSESGRFVMVFNGEVYNFGELRSELESGGHRFRGHSDTEVMLAAIEEWGLESSVRRFVGMFAIALWDRKEHRLSLIRDRLGIKPLYYGNMNSVLLFGSELKALRAHPAFRPDINRGSLTLFMQYQYVPAPFCIYEGVRQLPPGTILTLKSVCAKLPEPEPYWFPSDVAEHGQKQPFSGTELEAADQLESLLRDSIGLRMIADVPLGAFLSGGVDSSVVVALMQAQSNQRVKTFSIGFHEAGYNEARHASAVAAHLGTEHTELYVRPEQARDVIPLLPSMYDEPFGDSSQIPTFLVSQLARRHVTVSLSGDGGDELFGGYNRYALANMIWKCAHWMPIEARRRLADSLVLVEPAAYDRWTQWLTPFTSRMGLTRPFGHKIHTLSRLLESESSSVLYQGVLASWKRPGGTLVDRYEPMSQIRDPSSMADLSEFVHRMMFLDMITYLPGDILTKVDRASMAVGLEARVPLLDHRVVEFAWQLPLNYKYGRTERKRILRSVLYRYVPRELIERPKMGFAVPVGSWLRGPLREWAETLLDESRLRQQGLFDHVSIRQIWSEHLSCRRNRQDILWSVLMFQSWFDRWCG